MNCHELKRALNDVCLRLEVATRSLYSGREVDSYYKLQGVRDKLSHIIDNISNEIEKEKNIEESEGENN